MEHSIWRYLKAYRTDCVLGPLCKLIEARWNCLFRW